MTFSKLYSIFVISFVVLCLPKWCSAQANVQIQVNKKQITIGEWVEVNIQLENITPTDKIFWPTWTDSLIQNSNAGVSFEIVEAFPVDTVNENNAFTLSQRLVISAYDSGIAVFPSQQIEVLNANNASQILTTHSFQMPTVTVLVDTTKEVMPIKDIITVEMTWKDYLDYILIGGLVLVVLLVLAWYFLKKRKKQPEAILAPIILKSLEEEMRELFSALLDKRYMEQGEAKLFYSELSSILRIYLYKRYGINAMEMTTKETIAAMRKRGIGSIEQQQLQHILKMSDLVKFAKGEATIEHMKMIFDAGQQFIHDTLPKEITTDERFAPKI